LTPSLKKKMDSLWDSHSREWRQPSQICSQWNQAAETPTELLRSTASGKFWDTLEAMGATVLLTREYEHLVMALSHWQGRPKITFMRLPHPSGLAVDLKRNVVYLASTRNPNQVYDLSPVTGLLPRLDGPVSPAAAKNRERPLIPVRSRFLPGCLYLHDLAVIQGKLYANAVGLNSVVQILEDGRFRKAWWPRSIEKKGGPVFGRNHLQLNSIAAGRDLKHSFFSASAEKISNRRPGHLNFPVDGYGVVFSGKSRNPVVTGLTRPHSARLHDGKLWMDNSGYGEFGYAEKGKFVPLIKLPGWTRGLCFNKGIALVGTSRVIPRYQRYAPGLDASRSRCALHLIDLKGGKLLGSLTWPFGNQIFAIEAVPKAFCSGFPFSIEASQRKKTENTRIFYAFRDRVIV
jgi:uncharacterized protein (TIGR03032 family)